MIGIFGGTFDPVHYGHLRPLWDVKEALSLDELRLIPCFIPPHRDEPGAMPEQRLEMLRLAVQGTPEFAIDTRELERGGPSYMVDTLQSLRDEIGATSMSLIMGMDAFVMLHTWHQWQRLFELAHIVVMHRPGGQLPESGVLADELLKRRLTASVESLKNAPAGCVFVQKVTQLDISATQIRTILAKNGDVRFLMPDPVRQYIAQAGLYARA